MLRPGNTEAAEKTLAEKIAWLLFCVTSLHLAFLFPYVVLLPGERVNLFSGLWCLLSLAATLWAAKKEMWVQNRGPLAICLLLAALLLLSGSLSAVPQTNILRGLVLLASALGGFWGGRILLAPASRQRSFLQLSLLMLAGILLISLGSFAVFGDITQRLDPKYHPLATKILLLWFAPLALLWGRSRRKILGALLIGLSYLVLALTQLRSAVLLPLVLGAIAVFWRGLRLKYFLLILLAAAPILFFFIRHLPPERIGKEYEPAYYRVENYLFSWHVAVKHPFLGIGLLTPRDEFAKDYEIKYPYVTREQFVSSLKGIKVADNMFLTFMAGVGFPFLLLYSFSLIMLLTKLTISVGADPAGALLPPLALFLPLVGALLSFFIYDVLLHPQVCWFFHLLLGMISRDRE